MPPNANVRVGNKFELNRMPKAFMGEVACLVRILILLSFRQTHLSTRPLLLAVEYFLCVN